MKLTKPQSAAIKRIKGLTPIAWVGALVAKSLVDKGLALTTTTREVALTPFGKYMSRAMSEQRSLFPVSPPEPSPRGEV